MSSIIRVRYVYIWFTLRVDGIGVRESAHARNSLVEDSKLGRIGIWCANPNDIIIIRSSLRLGRAVRKCSIIYRGAPRTESIF